MEIKEELIMAGEDRTYKHCEKDLMLERASHELTVDMHPAECKDNQQNDSID